MAQVTQLLAEIEQGESHAAEQLLPLVYDELRRLAAAKLAQEKSGQTLQATALVHEAYLRLVTSGAASAPLAQRWDGRGHFFAAAAEAMRRILIERARRKGRQRHGGGHHRVELPHDLLGPGDNHQILLLDEALTKLADIRPQAAQLVQLRFFAGLTTNEAAPVVGISSRSARRLWTFAQAWLRREMETLLDRRP